MSTLHAISTVRLAFGAGAATAAAALAGPTLVAAVTDGPALPTGSNDFLAMAPLAAIAIVSAAASWILLQAFSKRIAHAAGFACAALVGVIAAGRLLGYLSGASLGLAPQLLRDLAGDGGGPGQLGVATATALLLAAAALGLTRSTSEVAEGLRHIVRLAGLAIPLFVLALFLYGADALAVIRGFEGSSFATALALALVLLAIGFDRPSASLRWQIAHIGVAVIAPLAALTLHFASAERESALAHAADQLNAAARSTAERQDAVIEQARQMLVFVARSPLIHDVGPGCVAELAQYQPLNPAIRAIFTIGRDGLIRCGNLPDMVSVNVADRDYVKIGRAHV